jgi:hypothetical protein
MAALRFIGFTGEQPRVLPRLLPDMADFGSAITTKWPKILILTNDRVRNAYRSYIDSVLPQSIVYFK